MFTLNIECSKDFDELHIKFSDGTSTVTTKNNTPRKPTKVEKESSNLDTEASFDVSLSSIVKKPIIEDREREVKIASELQDLDI